MNINDILKVKIIDEDHKGNGIAKVNNFVIFIKGALLNEELEIKIIDVKKRYATGKIVKIIEKSKNRIDIICPYFYECGGCSFLHKNIKEEEQIKEKHINNLFNNEKINRIISTKEYNYRNKVTLHVINNELGFYDKNTNSLQKINYCYLLDNEINKIISILEKYDLTNIKEIMIRKTKEKDIMIKINGFLNDNDLIDIIKLDNLKSLYFNDKLIYNNEYLIEEINNIKYTIYPNAFFQVNKEGMIKIYDKVKEYSSAGNKLLDLYCGTGTIGIYLKDNYKQITGIEINKDSIKNANLNKKINNIKNIEFINNDSKYIKEKDFDCIIVDPPRSGLTKDVIKKLLELKSKKIIYVSCNPDTLKKNIDDLKELYNIKEISIINMFPRTEHCETICILERK